MMTLQQTKVAAQTHIQTPFDRITQVPGVMGGKPTIRGMRVTVSMILSQLGSGETIDALLAGFPWLEREDILQAMRYAAWLAEGRDDYLVAV
jgi:uncharacterized protein (DUF433 family)